MFHSAVATGAKPSVIMLKRVILWTLGLAVAAFLTLIAFAIFFLIWNFDSAGSSDARREAEAWLSNELSRHDCLTQQDVRDIAGKRDWRVETHPEFYSCIDKKGLANWTSITIQPPLMMSTPDENRRYFGFDVNGCSVDWSYSSSCN